MKGKKMRDFTEEEIERVKQNEKIFAQTHPDYYLVVTKEMKDFLLWKNAISETDFAKCVNSPNAIQKIYSLFKENFQKIQKALAPPKEEPRNPDAIDPAVIERMMDETQPEPEPDPEPEKTREEIEEEWQEEQQKQAERIDEGEGAVENLQAENESITEDIDGTEKRIAQLKKQAKSGKMSEDDEEEYKILTNELCESKAVRNENRREISRIQHELSLETPLTEAAELEAYEAGREAACDHGPNLTPEEHISDHLDFLTDGKGKQSAENTDGRQEQLIDFMMGDGTSEQNFDEDDYTEPSEETYE
jgi:hypothetical protein